MQADIYDKTLQLNDGRKLSYTDYNSSSLNTLFYFGNSRLEVRILVEYAQQSGIRLIGTDRPGIGNSDFKKGRQLLDWPVDIIELADNLNVGQFAVMGVSAGGPYALACAYSIPDRLTACGIVSGVGPVRVHFYQRFPWFLKLMMWAMGRFFRNEKSAKKAILNFTRNWPEADRKTLLVPEIQDLWVTSLTETFRKGAKGLMYDTILVEAQPWDFKLEDVIFPDIYLWHGELDKDVPVIMGKTIEMQLPHCKANYYSDLGHLSVLVNKGMDILETLMKHKKA